MRRSIFLVTMMAVASAPALAQTPAKCVDATINHEEDEVQADQNAKTVTATGNVIVSQCDMRMRADGVRMEGVEGSVVNKIVASGRVIVDSPSGIITGDVGSWDVGPRTITFTGKVVLTNDKVVIRGTVLTYNLDTHQANFSKPGGRVQGLFTSPQSGRSP